MPPPLSPDARRRLSGAIKVLLARLPGDPERNQSALAEKLGCAPSTISRLASKDPVGGSYELVVSVSKELNQDPSAILNGSPDGQQPPAVRELSNFNSAFADARARAKEERLDISKEALEKAGDFRLIPTPIEASARLLITLGIEAQKQIDAAAPVDKKKPARPRKN